MIADPTHVAWTPSRDAGLERLAAFLPNAGAAYARDRNVDRGPTDRANVSALSPWIRRRLVTEAEVVRAALDRHGARAAEKFIQEVFWRTYWKGWLEQRPQVWRDFERACAVLSERFADDDDLARARAGKTGIDPFDAWARELVETGFLHNHARMCFASIWIFTLRLPWQLGARFFLEHLLDADPASNTLSWRWVAGLHTRGKHYLARAANIRDNTLGRFDPRGLLNEGAAPLVEDDPVPGPAPIPSSGRVTATRVALLLTEEDLDFARLALTAEVTALAALAPQGISPPGSPARRFVQGALDGAVARASAAFGREGRVMDADALIAWGVGVGVEEILTPYAPVGPAADALARLEAGLGREGVRLVRLISPWDARAWPAATAGFFKFRERIPAWLRAL